MNLPEVIKEATICPKSRPKWTSNISTWMTSRRPRNALERFNMVHGFIVSRSRGHWWKSSAEKHWRIWSMIGYSKPRHFRRRHPIISFIIKKDNLYQLRGSDQISGANSHVWVEPAARRQRKATSRIKEAAASRTNSQMYGCCQMKWCTVILLWTPMK